MKKNYLFLSLIIGLGLITVSCKPTEKGYKAAYDAAVGKRQKAQENVMVNGDAITMVQSVDGPQVRNINGKQVYVLGENLKKVDESDPTEKSFYNVAVAVFKMPANCNALVSDLKNDGYKAFGGQSADNKYYVIVASFPELEQAAEFYEDYKSKNQRAYVGLPEAPVIILSK